MMHNQSLVKRMHTTSISGDKYRLVIDLCNKTLYLTFVHYRQLVDDADGDRGTDVRQTTSSSGNRVISITKNEDMWNSIMHEHKEQNANCDGFLSWDRKREKYWGMSTEQYGKCNKCEYRSGRYVLYDEIITGHRGRRAAMINHGVHVGLSQVSLGPTGLKTILHSCNIPAPTNCGMQKAANKVLPKLQEENIRDMHSLLGETKKKLAEQGLPDNIMAFQIDGTYNNAIYSGIGKTPFCPATQTCYVVAENSTAEHKVVGLINKNKLCSKGKLHTSEQEIADCNCSANITIQTNIDR